MSLEGQWSAIYRLYYKADDRLPFIENGQLPDEDLTDDEAAQLKNIEAARLERIVELHENDLGFQWYRPRFPACWNALQATLSVTEAELVSKLTNSDAFELRTDDDKSGAALQGFIEQEIENLTDAPWIEDLLHYERLLLGQWPDGQNLLLEEFSFDVQGIYGALLDEDICPLDEPEDQFILMMFKTKDDIREGQVTAQQAEEVMQALQGGETTSEAKALIDQITA
ncbi:MAG: hypothetical protein L3J82_04060 [Planctomycetes bacterium]|nr:hypothetical protein [Planctomycetota bacterium]